MNKILLSFLTTCILLFSTCFVDRGHLNIKVAAETNNSLSTSISVPIFPSTTGPYLVGTTNFNWVDNSRKDLITSDPDDDRELMVQIWYPIDSGKGKKKASYLPASEAGIQQMVSSIGLRDQFTEINSIDSNSYEDGLLSNKKAKYPIVLFSHGNSQSRWNYQTITRELASRGFIVVSIEHTHFALGTEFNNGKYIPNDYFPTLLDQKKDDEDVNEIWVKDIQFVINQLEILNQTDMKLNFKNKLDLNKIAAIGHSLGGAAAARALQIDPRIKSAIDIDGSLIGLSGKTAKMEKPFAFIKTVDHINQMNGNIPPTPPEIDREQVLKVMKQFKYRYQQAVSGSAYDITIFGASHMNFSDNPLLQPYLAESPMDPPLGTAESAYIYKVTNKIIWAFLEETLNGKKRTILEQKNPYQGVEIIQ